MNNLKTHMGWLIFILAALLIGALSVSWATLDEIPTIISIALGLSSLVLAMIAIVQALTGTGTLMQSLLKIETAADRALAATNSVKDVANILSEKAAIVDQLPTVLGSIHDRMDQIAAVNAVPKTQGQTVSTPLKSASRVDELYGNATKGFNIAMYVALRSFESNKPFVSTELFSEDDEYMAGSVTAFVLSVWLFDLIDVNYVQGQILVRDMGEFPPEKVREMMAVSMKSPTLRRFQAQIDQFFSDGDEAEEDPELTES